MYLSILFCGGAVIRSGFWVQTAFGTCWLVCRGISGACWFSTPGMRSPFITCGLGLIAADKQNILESATMDASVGLRG
jgi:hypothetical protein